jgi:type II secretory pathway component GspD/PulD (secretin)
MFRTRLFSKARALCLAAALAFLFDATLCAHVALAATTASFSAQEESLREVLPRLAKVYHANLSLPPDPRGVVNVSLTDATLDQALSAVLSPLGYKYRHENGIVVIYRASATPDGAAELGPTVIPVTVISVERAATIVRTLYPSVNVRTDGNANAIIVVASPDDAAAIRTIVQQLDIKNPTAPSVDAVPLRTADPSKTAAELRALYPHAEFEAGPNRSVLIRAPATDMPQIKTLIASLDSPPQAPAGPPSSSEAVTIVRARPADVARAVSREIPGVRADVSGSTVILTGSADAIGRAKALIVQIDVPPPNAHVAEVYRIRSLDANSVADLLAKSFPDAQIVVDHDINAISVNATGAQQQRIGDAIKQLDVSPQSGVSETGPIVSGPGGTGFEVVTLRSAIPNQGQAGAAATDASTAVITTLQQLVPSIRVSPLGTPGQIALIGDPVSLRLAKEYLAKLDVPAPLVVLDTEVVEIDETVARNVGLQLNPPAISTTFTEAGSLNDQVTSSSSNIGFQPLTRTPLSFTAILNLQIQEGNAKVLADPRITTISGRTATIRAGDTLNILTTTGGGAGTIATTQLQSFQTGVTLDITPLVTPDNFVTVALHPVVNSLESITNGIPQISTRDTQTVVHLKNNQTLVIGGLIEESVQKTVNKLPLLGDLPLVGGLFKNSQISSTRNELIIVVTPHVLADNEMDAEIGPELPAAPKPGALPKLPANSRLHTPIGQMPSVLPTTAPEPTPQPASVQMSAPPQSTAQVATGQSAVPNIVPVNPSAKLVGGLVVYGKRPASNIAGPNDPPVVYYAALGPSTVTNRTNVSITAITSTNVTNLTASYGSQSISMGQIRPGEWQALFPFSTSAISAVGAAQVPITLTASRQDGAASSIVLPVGLVQ